MFTHEGSLVKSSLLVNLSAWPLVKYGEQFLPQSYSADYRNSSGGSCRKTVMAQKLYQHVWLDLKWHSDKFSFFLLGPFREHAGKTKWINPWMLTTCKSQLQSTSWSFNEASASNNTVHSHRHTLLWGWFAVVIIPAQKSLHFVDFWLATKTVFCDVHMQTFRQDRNRF